MTEQGKQTTPADTPYGEGIKAGYAQSESRMEIPCPYPPGSTEAVEWERGWGDAMSDWYYSQYED